MPKSILQKGQNECAGGVMGGRAGFPSCVERSQPAETALGEPVRPPLPQGV